MQTKLSGSIKLFSPIEINGKEINTLSYDLMKIDEELLSKADSLSRFTRKPSEIVYEENDYAYHRYLGMAAVIAENSWIDWEDLKRLKGIDLKSMAAIGRAFFFAQAEFESETSEELQEPTADISTQA